MRPRGAVLSPTKPRSQRPCLHDRTSATRLFVTPIIILLPPALTSSWRVLAEGDDVGGDDHQIIHIGICPYQAYDLHLPLALRDCGKGVRL